jgi:eukaryotic-like serine/threonine-protein kinase
MEPFEGQLLAGKYRVERVLGQGGMGVVVAAIHQQLEQRVALKFLVPGALSNEEAVGRFMREARSAVRLMSEHVARVIDVGTLPDGAPYIVMEYLEGQDLAALVAEQGPLPIETAVEYVLQACEALAEAHASGIIHRDLKPANLFLIHRRDGTPCVKVLDFGIAKISSKSSVATLAKTNGAMGTPFYMAPEQMKSARNADARSDIWSLGIVLYELLSGDVAFARETLPALCASILTDPPPGLRERRPEVPARLEAVVMNCLAKDPADRYQDVAELAAALSEFATEEARSSVARVRRILGGDSAAARTAIGGDVDPEDVTQAAQLETRPALTSPARKQLAPWLALAAVAGVAAIGAVVLLTRPTPPSASPRPEAATVRSAVVSEPPPRRELPEPAVAEPEPRSVPTVAPAETPRIAPKPVVRREAAAKPKPKPVAPAPTIVDFGDRK